jgi:hypothetical protein
LVGAVLLAGCTKKDAATTTAASAGTAVIPTTTTTEPPRVPAPLTGLPVAPDEATRPVVSVKVDNSPAGRPQAGLGDADIVFEEKVEGGVTRFVAVFESKEAALVGPIRSVRTTDPGIVSPLGGVFAFSGGVAASLKRLSSAPVRAVSEDSRPAAFTYPAGKQRPYATFATTTRLRKEADKSAKTPPAFFPYLVAGEAFTGAGAAPAVKATIDFGGRTTGALDWDAASKTWLRTTDGAPHTLSDGKRLAFTNVIIQRVGYRRAGYNDVAGNPVDEALVVGSGTAIVLVDGKQVAAKWTKAAPTAVTVFTDTAGAPIKLATGNTLVMLPPTGAAITVS